MRTDPTVDAWAQALFALASADDTVERVDADLRAALDTIGGHRKLKNALAGDGITGVGKAALMIEVFGEGLSPVVVGALVSLAQGGRLELLSRIHQAYETTSERARNVTLADVTTAVPLDDDLRSRLAGKLETMAGRKVILREHVDPGVLGGVIVRMGGKIMDGSVRAKLAGMRRRMAGARSEA